jgi:hypothetical protein
MLLYIFITGIFKFFEGVSMLWGSRGAEFIWSMKLIVVHFPFTCLMFTATGVAL